jgi:nucleoside diphosphate kinase
MSQTFVMLKPDTIKRHLEKDIIDIFLEAMYNDNRN